MIPGVLYSELFHLMEHNPENNSWRVLDEVMDWLTENHVNIKEQEFTFTDNSRGFGLLFESDEDVMAFKLRWL